jgi:hypothetical protein
MALFISSFPRAVSSLIKVIPPKQTAVERTWKKYIRDTTEAAAGADLNKAQVICLGDVHSDEWQNAWRGAFIDHYGSDGDIVLCEGYTAMHKIPQRLGRFTAHKKLLCYGWDNPDLCCKQRDGHSGLIKLKDKYKEPEPSLKWSKEDKDTWRELMKAVEAHHFLRTFELTKTAKSLAQLLRPGQKLFIISGSDHLFYKCNEPALNYYQFNMVESLKAFKTAMLLPKELGVNSLEDEKNYIKKLEGKSK